MGESITPEMLIDAYESGIFPMAIPQESDTVYWFSPDPRAIIPLEAYHIPRSVRRASRKAGLVTTTDRAFEAVTRKCSARVDTWISEDLIDLYMALFRMGFAHSVESWHGDRLVGGLYGVSVGGAFFAESMYHDMTDASNVALADLIARLTTSDFALLDTQYLTPHLERFGAIEISRESYLARLDAALRATPEWLSVPGPMLPPKIT